MILRFCIYGFTGWFLEIFWTSLASLLKKDFRLIGTTSAWMFFIYGSVLFFEPVCSFISVFPFIVRGVVYTLLIFMFEYLTGYALKLVNICPWDYSECRYSVCGIIRLDYAPVWFIVGLLFERLYMNLLEAAIV